jgi:eukaryotic-like serine/threonine-protein kinase
MDNVKARILENELRGKVINKWTIDSLIDHGKSAAVFKGHADGIPVAVKVFDQELIEKYGDASQVERIQREIALQGHRHPNLISILGGGVDAMTGSHYIVMEYLPGANLKKTLNDIPAGDIALYIQQLASAAEFLEGLSIAHRDIKPENIIVDLDAKKLTLLDLGVIRPIGEPGVTDVDGVHNFVGTLQYSPPEFLLRKEEDTELGWRAVTFYQIGGVLHDLIMKRPLFAESEYPYANLVNAVQNTIPVIQSSQVASELIGLAECCLLKDPQSRTRLVSWEKFQGLTKADVQSDAKMRVSTRIQLHQAQNQLGTAKPVDSGEAARSLHFEINEQAKQSFRAIRAANTALPPLTVTPFAAKNGLIVKASIEPSARLLNELTICVRFEVVDGLAKALEMFGFAYAGQSSSRETPQTGQWKSVFQGIYDASSMHRALEVFVYECLDWAQQVSTVLDGTLERD